VGALFLFAASARGARRARGYPRPMSDRTEVRLTSLSSCAG
jgi:hypothetical protein